MIQPVLLKEYAEEFQDQEYMMQPAFSATRQNFKRVRSVMKSLHRQYNTGQTKH